LPTDKNGYFKEQLNKRRQGDKELVSQYIVSKLLLCLDVNPHMTEKEIMFYILEGLILELQRELYLKDLQELKGFAVRVETALKCDNKSNYENGIINNESIETLDQGCLDFRCIGSTFATLILTRSTSNELSNYYIHIYLL
jgi:hypothetical protein